MNKRQWRVLYRQFLFRVFDPEILSAQAQGGATKLLGQFAALLVFVSVVLSFAAILLSSSKGPGSDPRDSELLFLMIAQHFLISSTMLVVGLFAVLSWDATFPDQRDVLVLAPLPVRTPTMFLAKVAAVATSLGLTIVLLHSGLGLIMPLVFAVRATPAVLPALTRDATPVPVAARGLQAVLDKDLRQALTTGELAPGTSTGLAIGVWKHGDRQVFTYGAAKPDSLFEIGSVSKTFTGLMLAQMVAQGKVRLNEPVRELLPPFVDLHGVQQKASGQEITLLDLATHHSGLPTLPDNFHPEDRSDPYADYGSQQLYTFLSDHGFAKQLDAGYLYSNLGTGLLGFALAVRNGNSYSNQLREEITGPLGMTDTVVQLSAEQQRRFLQGRDLSHKPVHAWDFDALAGAGGIRSTADDMITYLEANLHPEKYPALRQALVLSHQVRAQAEGDQQIALTWLYSSDTGTWGHDGGTSGFSSEVFFNPAADCAAVVLINDRLNPLISASRIGEHILQRLRGDPAVSLDNVLVPVPAGVSGLYRSFAAYWITMLAAGVFVYGSVLAAQGLTALALPRWLFLRLSGYLQLAAIGLIVGGYFLQPGFVGLNDIAIGPIGRLIQWLPSYCFLALYQQLNGSMHPALEPLARRAWIGLAVVVFGTAVVYTLSYWRTLRQIVEQPDIVPGASRWSWLPRFGNQAQTAIGQFSLRTMARSRQHRLILVFYLGIGLAFTSLLLKGPGRKESPQLWIASIMMMALAVLGTRVAFALPLDLRANWIFRVIGVRGGLQTRTASRRALLLLSVIPVWLVTAALCFWPRPGRQNAGHLAVLGLLGMILADVCLLRFRKIPFTCSWLPGKSQVNMAFVGALVLLSVGSDAVTIERNALRDTGSMTVMVALLTVTWVCIRRTAMTLARREEQELRFEEEAPPELMGLGLYRDGVMAIERRETTQDNL